MMVAVLDLVEHDGDVSGDDGGVSIKSASDEVSFTTNSVTPLPMTGCMTGLSISDNSISVRKKEYEISMVAT